MKQITLTQGKVALVDDADYEKQSRFKWNAHKGKHWYAYRSVRHPFPDTLKLHREIMQAPSGVHVDHKDGDGLNCQRYNMRLATPLQNAANRRRNRNNTSGFKGVSWKAPLRKWQAAIQADRKTIYLGVFADIREAARAYDVAARQLHGEFSHLNFPDDV